MGYKCEAEIRGFVIGNMTVKFKEPRKTKILFDEAGRRKFARIFGDTILINDYLL